MSYPVRFSRASEIVPIGASIMRAFRDIEEWIIDQGFLVSSVNTDQSNERLYCTFTLPDLNQAVMLKMTWGGL